jgi:hypothetical protein
MQRPRSLWDDVRNQIRSYCVINARSYKDTRWEQRGGHRITVGDIIYNWRESRSNSEFVTYRLGPTPECALLLTDHDTDGNLFGILQGVRNGVNCSASSHATTKDLMRAVWKLAFHKGIRYIEFTDESKLICRPSGVRISLSELYFVSYGHTWYETIWPILASDTVYIDRAREEVAVLRWSDVYSRLHSLARTHFLPSYPGIDATAPGSASAVVRYLKGQNWCVSVGAFSRDLILAFGINIRDITWRTVDITGPSPP